MCGFTGFLQVSEWSLEHRQQVVQKMTNCLAHRGPDGHGFWVDEHREFALGHRRLSIQDLSQAGHQPMLSSSGRYVIAYNGEVYNTSILRHELEQGGQSIAWQGHSDTEVILACIESWGLEKAVSRFIGMFAFALWDREEKQLQLVRDRLGIKPLYYGLQRGAFLFGSELKSLRVHPFFQGEINRDALTLYFRHNVIPAPYSIYQNVYKLTPGTILTLSQPSDPPKFTTYWNAWGTLENAQLTPFSGSYADAVEELNTLLLNAVQIRLLSDVPLGAFLSGGIDSSTVVALMQQQSSQPIQTFSIGFAEGEYNEAPFAAAVAKHLGTHHTELSVTPKQALDVIPKLPAIYDEPFADSSQIPTLLVSQLTKQYVTVALSGDGGDELFCGYNRYLWAAPLWNQLGRLPKTLRSGMSSCLQRLPVERWNQLYNLVESVVPKRWRMQAPGRNAHRLAEILGLPHERALYQGMVSHWNAPTQLVLNGEEPVTRLTQHAQPGCSSFTEWMMAQDLVTYLPDDILTKVDRASMDVSIEARVPLLDHRVVEFAWSLPLEWKLKNQIGKRILRDVLYRHVPQSLVERPKMGFGVPIDRWLRHDLRDWAENLLDSDKLHRQGFLNPVLIRQKWNEHLSGTTNWQYHLWDVLMWQAWWEQQ